MTKPENGTFSNKYAEVVDEGDRKYWDEYTKQVALSPSYILLNLFLGFSF